MTESSPVRIPPLVSGPRGNESDAPRWLRLVLCLGLGALFIGMGVLPAGISYNPGKPFQHLLTLTLYLPTLALLLIRPRRWLSMWRQPLFPWAAALLAWGALSLLWTSGTRPSDELGRNVSILLFLCAWTYGVGADLRRMRLLLCIGAVALAGAALAAMTMHTFQSVQDDRLSGFGVMANANLAAAGMGAAFLWLYPWKFTRLAYRVAQWLVLAILALFVLRTYTRSAWAALFAAMLLVLLSQGGRRAWMYAAAVALAGIIGVIVEYPALSARGWSLRPEIFMHAKELFEQHMWRGLGQGAQFKIVTGGQVLTHAHNMFSQLAIELGLPGLLLWTGVWLVLGWRAWRERASVPGQIVLGLWMFATVMVQFDLPHLLDSPRPGWLITWLPLAMSFSFASRARTVPEA